MPSEDIKLTITSQEVRPARQPVTEREKASARYWGAVAAAPSARSGIDLREVRGDNERREIAAAQKVLASQATGSNRVAENVTR